MAAYAADFFGATASGGANVAPVPSAANGFAGMEEDDFSSFQSAPSRRAAQPQLDLQPPQSFMRLPSKGKKTVMIALP